MRLAAWLGRVENQASAGAYPRSISMSFPSVRTWGDENVALGVDPVFVPVP
jgi:hypothetical protein